MDQHEKIVRAEELASRHLADGNAARERGDLRRAEVHDRKGQYWLDQANRLRGWN